MKEESVLPLSFDGDPQLGWAILLGIAGFAFILLLERLADKKIEVDA